MTFNIRVEADDDGILFKDGDTTIYDIPYHKCSTPGEIFGWIEQLATKKWVNAQTIRHFMHIAAAKHNITVVQI